MLRLLTMLLVAQTPSHLLVSLELSPTGLKVLELRRVNAPLPRLRVAESQRWHLAFRNSHELLLHQVDLAPGDELRAEFQASVDGGVIDGHSLRKTTSVFVARLPDAAGSLTLSSGSTTLGTVAIAPPNHQ